MPNRFVKNKFFFIININEMVKFTLKLTFSLLIDILSSFFRNGKVVLVGSHFGFVGETAACYRRLVSEGVPVFYVFKNRTQIPIGFSGPYVLRNSFKWFISVLGARTFIISHVVNDIFPVKPKNVRCINLWHGEPLKLIGYQSNVEYSWLKNKIKTDYDDWDYIVVNNDRFKMKMQLATHLFDRVIISASFLYTELAIKQINFLHALSAQKKILYLPTFRGDSYDKVVVSEAKLMRKICEEVGIDFRMKLHPKLAGSFSDSWVIEGTVDVYDLIVGSDMVITDYSSVIYDCFSLNKPVGLIVPDVDAYVSKNGGFFDDLKELPVSFIKESFGSVDFDELDFSDRKQNDASDLCTDFSPFRALL